MMRIIISFMLLLISMHGAATTSRPALPYGGGIEFDVMREGERVGQHRLSFSRQGPVLRVDIRMELDFRVLLLFRYRFRYSASEWWQGGALQRLEVELDENGEQSRISARKSGEVLQIRGDPIRGESLSSDQPLPLLTTNHWNPEALQQQALLNTLTGEISQVQVEFEQQDRVRGGSDYIRARRYHYGGGLSDTRVWFDEKQRWVGMSFIAQDGSEIRFVCRRIGQIEPLPAIGTLSRESGDG